MNPDEFPSITFSSINCNSLNMSNIGSLNHKLKLYGITKLRTDIIFLSDLRLNNAQNISCIPTVRSTFRTNPYGGYEFVHNSTMNKRGVGILLKISTCSRICEEWRDPAENSLLLKLQIEGKPFTFIAGCIYGPNKHEPAFFDFLRNNVPRNLPVILGGDWNCTPNGSPPRDNPDVINMVSIPNKRHSDYLCNLCDDLTLYEPYRALHPNFNEYTF
jgi:hypothetical protein